MAIPGTQYGGGGGAQRTFWNTMGELPNTKAHVRDLRIFSLLEVGEEKNYENKTVNYHFKKNKTQQMLIYSDLS